MIFNLERHWYRRSLTWLTFLLLPFAYLFRLIVKVRLLLYRYNFIETIHFPMPVIVVGNLTVGGTGKTPLVIWLARFLMEQGFRPGIVSRGIGGEKQTVPLWVDAHADPFVVGDEAVLLARHSRCPVVICVDRVAAVKELIAHVNCNVILSDDGLQHYHLGRHIEIAVLDGDRGLGNAWLLPAGPLRESSRRLQEVDFVVQQGGVVPSNYFELTLQGTSLISIQDAQKKLPLEDLRGKKVYAVAGVGNPQRFFSTLRQNGLEIIERIFPDHYLYNLADFKEFGAWPILMTEKDAVKCMQLADERFWYLPVGAQMDARFQKALLEKL